MDHPGTEQIDDLPSSRLGTQAYWDHLYEQEVKNFDDHGEEGEVWFGMAAERRVIDWVSKNTDQKSAFIVEVGCGNGHLCLSLAKKGYLSVYGIDYSESAVRMSNALAQREQIQSITFMSGDLLNHGSMRSLEADIVIDKGTFDAICLGFVESLPENFSSKTEYFAHHYVRSIRVLAKSSHKLIITSCNWTEQELCVLFTKEGYQQIATISHPSFSFGGSQGHTVSSVIFGC